MTQAEQDDYVWLLENLVDACAAMACADEVATELNDVYNFRQQHTSGRRITQP